MLYIGIDLGTSSTKALLTNEKGEIIKSSSRSYGILYPNPGWTEQNPSDWVKALIEILKELSKGHENEINGISFGGQMHGLVVLDKDDNVIRPCILWNDGRTEAETEYLNEVIGKDNLSKYTGNIAFAGFTLPKILWMKNHEKENFDKISKIMLPKDYLAYYLSGIHATDYSDASGMLLLDVEHRSYSKEMLEIAGISESMLPKLYESYDVIGTLKEPIKKELNLKRDVNIVIGAGDNAAAAVGTGTVGNNKCNISLGTSGTIFITSDKYSVDKKNSLHSFCHADGGYHLMGCILSAASCNGWWLNKILNRTDFDSHNTEMSNVDINNGVYFLPYLSGERSPHNDVNIRGAFLGLSHTTTEAMMGRAVLEGVAFALRDCLEVAKQNGVNITSTKLCGGGSKTTLWISIIANVLNVPVEIPCVEEGPSYGASILAMVGSKEYPDIISATNAIIKTKEIIYPDSKQVSIYEEKYNKFKKIYPKLKGLL